MVKRFLKLGLAALAVLLVAAVILTWRAKHRLQRSVAEFREAGIPTHLSDLKRDVPVRDNAATYLAAVAADAEKLYERIHSFAHHDTDNFDWRSGLTEEQIAETAAGFDAYPQVLEAIDRASRCSDSAWPLNYEQSADQFIQQLLDTVGPIRTFARLNDCRARYLMTIGKVDEAADVYLRQLRLCRLQDNEPTLVVFLMNTACRSIAVSYLGELLQAHSLAESTYRTIETELAQHDAMPGFVNALKTEIPIGLGTYRTFPLVGRLRMGLDGYLEYTGEQIRIGAEDHYLFIQRKPALAGGTASMLVPAVDAAREAMNRMRAKIRCLRILNAIYAQGHDPGTPIELSQLNLPAAQTVDSYNGQPLHILADAQGWTVYSVGKDGQDNGGQLDDLADVGFDVPQARSSSID